MITPKLLKGFRDFSPKQTIQRQFFIKTVKEIFESYGFDPIETPALEYLETFQGNIGEDEKLFYNFVDHGGREVALRYDQTVPTCRYVAKYQNELPMPFKRYQIQPVWRADKPQKGRYREFLQCDIDIFGVETAFADAETIAVTIACYKKLGFKDFTIQISDRELYKGIEYPVISAIDKLDKIGKDGVKTEIIQKGYSPEYANEVLDTIFTLKPNETINTIFSYLKANGIEEKFFTFEPTMARSFSYSTGPIWEVKINGYSGGSVGGGERYDQLIERFTKTKIPATGIAFGLDRTIDAMEELGILPQKKTTTDILMTVFSPELFYDTLSLATELRTQGYNIDTYPNPKAKLSKQFKYADKKGIPFVVILGPEEKESGKYTLKNLETANQTTCTRGTPLQLIK